MNRKRLVMLLSLCFISIILNTNIVFAEGSCNKDIDSSRWIYDHEETVQSNEAIDVEVPGISKRVCCSRVGANHTEVYYCEYYRPTASEQQNNGQSDQSKEFSNIPCDYSDGVWDFSRSYYSAINESTTTTNSKICCQGTASPDMSKAFQCNAYIGKTNETVSPPSLENGETIESNCGVISDIIPYIKEIYGFIKIVMPIALIIFGVMDFSTPILSNDKDALSKAGVKFAKRCIIVIAIIFVPTILGYILRAYSEATGKDASLCGLVGMILQNWR